MNTPSGINNGILTPLNPTYRGSNGIPSEVLKIVENDNKKLLKKDDLIKLTQRIFNLENNDDGIEKIITELNKYKIEYYLLLIIIESIYNRSNYLEELKNIRFNK